MNIYRQLIKRHRCSDGADFFDAERPAAAMPATPFAAAELPPVWRNRIRRLESSAQEGGPALVTLAPELFWEFLQQLAQLALPVHIMTASPAAVQIYQGVIGRLAITGPWLNILDPNFNLHIYKSASCRCTPRPPI